MKISTLQWNIGGGKIRKPDDDPTNPLAYRNDDLNSFIGVLAEHNPDIITIQESHTNTNKSHAEIIARKLGLEYFANDIYEKSHLEKGQGLSQCVLSRFPIEKHSFTFFHNPKFETTGPKGEYWISHDKGVTSCFIKVNNEFILNVKTSHSFPYRRFNVDPLSEIALPLRKDMAEKLKPEGEIYLYQGDLNYNGSRVKELMSDLMNEGVEEVLFGVPTTPKGRKYDRIIFRGLKHIKSEIITDVLADHFPIYSEFEIN